MRTNILRNETGGI